MENKKEKIDELRYSQACIDHREKLHMMELTEETRKSDCNKDRFCYQEGCPIYKGEKISKATKTLTAIKTKEMPKRTPENPLGLNLEVFEPLGGDEKQKKEKKISREIEDFLYLQSRVISKLAWNPQIWKALDNLPTQDILDRLLGKTGLEGVATHVGGDMALKASKKTQKLFANLEQKFAEEDEKKGKAPPPNYENEDDEIWNFADKKHGHFEKGIFVEEKEEKKNEKTTKK